MGAMPSEMTRIRCADRWRRITVMNLAGGACLAYAATTMDSAASDRQALWQVVRACVATYELTGAAFPCLKVDLTGGVQNGYAVLRPPFGKSDTILTPTRKVVGVEDTWLQNPSSPNYFQAAWNARALATEGSEEPSALAINSRYSRTQDQLHIHIGCLVASARRRLQVAAASLPIGEWKRVDSVITDARVWGYRTGSADLAGFDPFRLAAQGLAATAAQRMRLMIAVTTVRVGGRDEFFVLASPSDAGSTHVQATAADLVEAACTKSATR
jgi:CDP-diacylglycerol pyrophosphatase